MDGVKVSHNI